MHLDSLYSSIFSNHQSSSVHHGVAAEHSFEVNPFAPADNEPFVNSFAPDPSFEASSSGEITIAESNHSSSTSMNISEKRTDSYIDWSILLGTLLDLYPPEISLLPMPCGASIIMYCRKSNRKTSNLLSLKIVGLRPCKKKSLNLIDYKYGN
ncbi:hypothetical protein Tco_1456923 [Tanacetum coccineum]